MTVPFPLQADGIASDPRFRPGDHPLLADHPIDQSGFPGVWTSDDREMQRLALLLKLIVAFEMLMFDVRPKRFEQVGDTLAMLRADGGRLAEPEPVRVQNAGLSGAPFRLV